MRNWFQFGNIKFDIDDGLVIEKCPSQNRPARKMDVYNVPGRNGDIVVMQDAWENVEQTYEIWGGNENINSATAFGYKAAELFKLSGYQKLTDSYDTTHYRKAYFAGPFDVENVFTRRGRAQLTFSCSPKRYLNSGGEIQVLTNNTLVTNPTPYTTRPILTVHGSGSGWFNFQHTIGNDFEGFTISNIIDGMVIDCEEYDCYYDDPNDGRIYLNDRLTLNNTSSSEWPQFFPGIDNLIIIDQQGGITSIDMVPNWWEL